MRGTVPLARLQKYSYFDMEYTKAAIKVTSENIEAKGRQTRDLYAQTIEQSI